MVLVDKLNMMVSQKWLNQNNKIQRNAYNKWSPSS